MQRDCSEEKSKNGALPWGESNFTLLQTALKGRVIWKCTSYSRSGAYRYERKFSGDSPRSTDTEGLRENSGALSHEISPPAREENALLLRI